MKIVINKENLVLDFGSEINRESFNGEQNLIKVSKNDSEGFYYIGTNDRDDYQIIEISSLPQDFISGKYFYNNNSFTLNKEYKEPEKLIK